MRIEVAGKSHVGMKRNINEDSFLVMPEQRLYCVADGMGGHFAGEIASKIAIDELAEFFRITSTDRDVTWPFKMDKNRNYDENRLATGIKLANARIYEAASGDPNYRGMGTTIATVHFAESSVYVGHVGDSRVYLLRGGQAHRLTEDHTLIAAQLKAGTLTREQAQASQLRNVITRAVGIQESVQVDTLMVDLLPKDLFLLCSDGLHGYFDDPRELAAIAALGGEAGVNRLVEIANERGGRDNITAVLVEIS